MSTLRRTKIAGRWVESPAWALALPFEVRPMRGFDVEAWPRWKATLLLLARAVKAKRQRLEWVRIHSHIEIGRAHV